MLPSPLAFDAYQLTTLVAHADLARLDQRVAMAFFFRRLPKPRNYVVACGLRRILEHAAALRFSAADLAALRTHPVFGPALAQRPALVRALTDLDGFEGDIDAVPEGTLTFAGPAVDTSGAPVVVLDAPLCVYTPLLQVRTSLVLAKLIETPWLGYLNHMSMVASKAARIVSAAQGKTVFEFGLRRTHPVAGLDASYAAFVGGVDATSNVAAYAELGVPASGTMDHFAIQASEMPGVPRIETEEAFFRAFAEAFPVSPSLLVDTYDTEGGLEQAVRATSGKLGGVRLDSNVNPESVQRARKRLAELGAPNAKIFVSDGLDEYRVRELAPFVDGFGVGENIACSPDAATGVGAVAKLVVNGYGRVTMKFAKGSGKATLPGELQSYRYPDHDLVALADEAVPAGGEPLLQPVWRGTRPIGVSPTAHEARARTLEAVAKLTPDLRALEPTAAPRKLVVADGLREKIDLLSRTA